jgi:hypothetical protein
MHRVGQVCCTVLVAGFMLSASTAQAQPLAPTRDQVEATTPGAPGSTPVSSTGAGDVFSDFFGENESTLLPTDCRSSNTTFWVTALAVDGIALLLFLLAHLIAVRRNWLKSLGGGFWSFAVLLLPFALAAGAALPAILLRSELYVGCMENADLRRLMVLSVLGPWLQGLVLGLAPVLVVAILAKVIHGWATK